MLRQIGRNGPRRRPKSTVTRASFTDFSLCGPALVPLVIVAALGRWRAGHRVRGVRYCLASVLRAAVMSARVCSTDFLPFTTSTTGWLKSSFPSASPVHGVLPWSGSP